ncbi:nucleotidyltransferase domain-containing protein, partial [Streptomyces sp. NBC_01527]|uniref:nucleotidyltransferase domain-containing protein n=1 Tax=Streptomyces sp. NBC_01527 TaxID=2903894 RepID=UPI00386A7910
MKRERATWLLADMITRLEDGGWPLGLVDEVYVFGSYARGALEPNDVDVVIEHGTDKRWLGESLDASINGRDSYVGMRQALRGRTRGISFQFRGRSSLLDEGFGLFLLWRKGEPFSLARERLASLTADPEAGPAPRDHMLTEFEGLQSMVPRPARIELFGRRAKGKISITPLRLLDGDLEDPEVARHVRQPVQMSPNRASDPIAATLARMEQKLSAFPAIEEILRRRDTARHVLENAAKRVQEIKERPNAAQPSSLTPSERCARFAKRMNDFLSPYRTTQWVEGDVSIRDTDLTFYVGSRPWHDALGAAPTVLFFLAYSYATLYLTHDLDQECAFPGLLLLDNPYQQ